MISVGEFTISKVYDGAAGQQGEKGDSGISVVKVSTQYYLSSSPISLEDGDWEDTQPQVTTGKYLWQRTKTVLSDNSVTYSDAVYAQTISGLVSDVDQVKGQITDKVWQSDITTSINTYDNSTVSTIRDRVSTTEQNLSGITTRVSDVESTTGDLGTRLTSAESSITQNADNIELKVSKDGVIASINESPESITISAEKVNIAGSASFTSLSNKVTAVENVADRNAELIRGTQTQGTYSWTGDSNTIAVLADGMEIRFWLPYSSDGTEVSDTITYFNGNTTSNKTNSGVGLRLTLKDGSSKTENIPVYYSGVTRLTTQYGYGNIIRMVYRENVKIHDSNITYYTVKKGFWCDANYDTNTSYVQYSSGMMVGANSVKPRSLVMRDTPTSIVSLSLSSGTDTNKSVYTGGLYYNKILYSIDNTTYATGETTGSIYDSYIIDLRYSTNCGSNLIASMPVYLVGTINNQDKMFYLDATQWWTQTVPTSADGKTYIYLGEAYSTHNIYLAVENKAYQYYNGRFITLEEIKDLEAMTWINSTGQNAADIIANWATDATSATTTINGGLIQTHTIQASHLATNAIMSNNYQASQNAGSPYSVTGSFLDLDNGNFYTPNFGLDNVNGNAYFNGEITATSGQIGDDTSNHWQIGTVVDFNGNQSAAIESNGTSYIQSGDWMISNNRIDTRHYDNQRKYTYLYEDGVYWDFGLHTPSLTSDNDYENNFVYIRNHENTIPTLEGAWNYVFRIDRNGMIYINGKSLDEKYASIDGVDGAYLPLTGGSLTGNLSVGGNLSVTGTITGLKNLSINGKTYNGSSAVTVGTIGAAYGGTGQTSLINSANALINALSTGSDIPVDNDYFVSQYVNGGTSTTTYHRRPMSTLWVYIKNKINAEDGLFDDDYVPKTGGEFTGAVTVSDIFTADEIVTESLTVNGTSQFTNVTSNYSAISTLQADEATVGNLIVNGVARFNNGLYGDITGKINGYTIAKDVPASALFTDTTYTFTGGTNKFTVTPKNGDAQTVSITPFIAEASNSSSGLMSASDKTTLDNIAANFSGGTITISNVTASNGLTYNYDSTTGITAITGAYPITTSKGTSGQVLIADSNGVGAWSGQDSLKIRRLDNKFTSRPTSANIASSKDRVGSLEKFVTASSMTEGKPMSDGHILHMNWDSMTGYDSQLFIPNANVSTRHIQWRTQNQGTWTNWTTCLDENNYNSYSPSLTGTGASGTWGISISGNANTATTASTATRANQDGNGNVIVDTYVTLSTDQTISGTKTFSAMPVASAGLCVGNSGTAGGLSLWNDKNVKRYGLALRTTADSGKHGYVQGDWATYNYMYAASASALPTRGWIFKDSINDKGVASISGAGNAVFNGSVTVGGNETNTSGCRQEFNEDLQCLEFIFN